MSKTSSQIKEEPAVVAPKHRVIINSTRVFGERNNTNKQVQDLRFYADGTGSNFLAWNEEMHTYATLTFPGLQDIFTGGTCVIPPLADPVFIDGEDFSNQLKMAKWIESNKVQSKRVEDSRIQLPQLYETMRNTTSFASEQVMKDAPEFAGVDAIKNPEQLRELARITHLVAVTGLAVADQRKAEMNYYRIKQEDSESMDAFLKRFNEKVDARLAAGCHKLKEPRLAFDVVQSLSTGYKQLATSLYNNAIMGVQAFPATIPEVAKIVANFKVGPSDAKKTDTGIETQAMFAMTISEGQDEERISRAKYTREEERDYFISKKKNHVRQREIERSNKGHKARSFGKKEKLESSDSDEEQKSYLICLTKYGGCGRAGHKHEECWATTMIDEEGQIVPKHAKRSGKKNREKATKGADKSEQVVNMAAMLSAYYPSDISGEAFFPMLTGGMYQYDTQSSDSDENCTTCNRPGHYAHTCSFMTKVDSDGLVIRELSVLEDDLEPQENY